MAAVLFIGFLLKKPGALIETVSLLVIGILKLVTQPFRDRDSVDVPMNIKPIGNTSSIQPNVITLQMIKDMEWFAFEKLTKQYLLSSGFNASLTQFGADGGIDLIIEKKDGRKAYVQCKAFGTSLVGVKFVREFYGVMAAGNVTEGYFVTSGSYTKDAKEFASNKPLKLVTGKDLLKKINELPSEKKEDIFKEIFADRNYKTPTCPNCGLKMVLRTNRRNGNDFWGCLTYPKCRAKMPLSKRQRNVSKWNSSIR